MGYTWTENRHHTLSRNAPGSEEQMQSKTQGKLESLCTNPRHTPADTAGHSDMGQEGNKGRCSDTQGHQHTDQRVVWAPTGATPAQDGPPHLPILYSQGRSLGSSRMLSLRFFLQQRAGYV